MLDSKAGGPNETASATSLTVMSHGIPTRVRETELKIRHPGVS